MTKQNTLLAVACLLAAAALVSADSCRPPTGTCPPNTAYKVTGRGRTKTGACVECPAGQFIAEQGSCCKRCKGVIYTDSEGAVSCVECPSGSSTYPRPKSQPRQPATTCMCSAGYQATGTSDITGVTGCAKCPPGTYNAAASSSQEACQPCPDNSVAPKSGTKVCKACENNSVADEASQTCMCPAHFYVQKSQGPGKGRGRGRGKSKADGRRLQASPASAKAAASDDDDKKVPSCTPCASDTQNSQLNTWPVCCEAGQAYNASTKTCETAGCSDGAELIDGSCVCAGGTALYVDGFCECNDGAEWDSTEKTCSCGGGAEYLAASSEASPDAGMPVCTCADGAAWMGAAIGCDCGDVPNVIWNSEQKTCDCPSGATWNKDGGECDCPDSATWNGETGECVEEQP